MNIGNNTNIQSTSYPDNLSLENTTERTNKDPKIGTVEGALGSQPKNLFTHSDILEAPSDILSLSTWRGSLAE